MGAPGLQVTHLYGEELREVCCAFLATRPALDTRTRQAGQLWQSCWGQGHFPQLQPHSPSGHRGKWGHRGDTGRNLKRENRAGGFRSSNPAHEPPETASCPEAAPEAAPAICVPVPGWAHPGKAAHSNSHYSLRWQAHEFTHPRRCARDQTSARSPCCSTAVPWLRRVASVLQSFLRDLMGPSPARDPSVPPRGRGWLCPPLEAAAGGGW